MEQIENKNVHFDNPTHYNNRELSWLAFNERVLDESFDTMNPLLERLSFLSIFSSNLDEFFMVRVAGLQDQVRAKFNKRENKSGLTPKGQIKAISGRAHELVRRQYDVFHRELCPLLDEEAIKFLSFQQLMEAQKVYVEEYFDEQIFPVLTPVAVDAYRPFPMLLNKSLNLAVTLFDADEENEEDKQKLGIVQVPSVLKRYIRIPTNEEEYHYIFLEDVISAYLHKLFTGYLVEEVTQFRITRNADLTIHEEGARDLLKEIEKELKKRKWGAAVRLEIKEPVDEKMLTYLLEELEIHEKDVYAVNGPLDFTFLAAFSREMKKNKDHLAYETLIPQPPRDLHSHENIFEKALEEDILLHHPYESFQPVVDFIEEAAEDENVLAIKQTLYRVSGDSPIIKSLKLAAEKGKQVTVLVELKARFDEENNVEWAKQLEKAGCHVIYGMNFLKTHSKITLVVRRKNGKIERFIHLGTGNYNDTTAKFYTDFGLVTTNKEIGIDATNFFNFLSGYTDEPNYYKLSVAPMDIREQLINLIDKEMIYHKEHGNGRIIAKMNSFTDKPLIKKLYEASMAGVKIDLMVRGICCLRAKVPGISDNITVRSIVGRFLEHSRIYYFAHNGEDKIFLSSADLMTRNMEKRVEISFPILQGSIKERIKRILEISLSDNVKAREQEEDGIYRHVRRGEGEESCDSQMTFFQMAYHVMEDEE